MFRRPKRFKVQPKKIIPQLPTLNSQIGDRSPFGANNGANKENRKVQRSGLGKKRQNNHEQHSQVRNSLAMGQSMQLGHLLVLSLYANYPKNTQVHVALKLQAY